MSRLVDKFLSDVCGRIRCRAAHGEVRDELTDHINCAVEALRTEGDDEDTATEKALSAMGDGSIIGAAFDRTHRPQTQWAVLLLTGMIISFGVLISYACNAILDVGRINFSSYIIAITLFIFVLSANT